MNFDRNQIAQWTAATSTEPTWRDGLTSDTSYLFLAVPKISRNGYKAITYGMGKIKFYPSPEALGLDRRALTAIGLHNCRDRREESVAYVRYQASTDQVKAVLNCLPVEEWELAPADWVKHYSDGEGKKSSRTRHPAHDSDFQVELPVPSNDKGGLPLLSASAL